MFCFELGITGILAYAPGQGSLLVILEKESLYLVAVSSADEPKSALQSQLDLLHAHFLAFPTASSNKSLACMPEMKPLRSFFPYIG